MEEERGERGVEREREKREREREESKEREGGENRREERDKGERERAILSGGSSTQVGNNVLSTDALFPPGSPMQSEPLQILVHRFPEYDELRH